MERARRGLENALPRRAGMPAAFACVLLLAAGLNAGATETTPRRVVSMNVCTDQMAMLIAAPGQLHSVSHLASDPGSSAMVKEAAAYTVNHGLAEEIFLMRPDLVLASAYSGRATLSMLRRLGFRVEEFTPETSFDAIRANMERLGAVLGREEKANQLIAALDQGLESLTASAPAGDQLVASYESNSYTAGRGSLTDAVIVAAGLENLGSRMGIEGTGLLPLETLVMSNPDVLVGGARDYDGDALAQQNFVHPAFRALRDRTLAADVPASWWICGGPFNLAAARILQDAAGRAKMAPERPAQ